MICFVIIYAPGLVKTLFLTIGKRDYLANQVILANQFFLLIALFFLSFFFLLNLKEYNVDYLYLVLTKSGEPCPASRRYWTRGVRSRMSSPNRQPGNRTVDAKYFTSKPPSIRCIDTYVDLRGGYENILFGERRGGRGWSPLLHSRLRAEKKKKRSRGGQRNKITTSMVVKVILTLQ